MARQHSSSDAGSGVVLHHRAAAAACACLTVDVAVQRVQPRQKVQPRLGQQMVFCTTIAHIQGLLQKVFPTMVFCNCGLPFSQRKLFSYHVYYGAIRSYSIGGFN